VKITSYKNRGMFLESIINESNSYYVVTDKALIFKKPTPIKVINVTFPNNKAVINKAVFDHISTLDYNGLYRGKYIEFDAKESLQKTSFPLSNIHEHQTKHIRNVIRHQGIVFLIIRMNDITYLLTGEDYISYIDSHNRKSIEYQYIEENAHIIKEGYTLPLDYLDVINKIYFKGE
jgi:recombination protein U